MNFINETFHVCINTHDYDRSVEFYKALGFTTKDQLNVETDTVKMHYLKHLQTGALVEVIEYKDEPKIPPPRLTRQQLQGLNHFGFFVENLKTTREALITAGATIVEEASRDAYDFIFACGPDNELIGFACMKSK